MTINDTLHKESNFIQLDDEIVIGEVEDFCILRMCGNQYCGCVETSRNNEGPIDPAAEEEP